MRARCLLYSHVRMFGCVCVYVSQECVCLYMRASLCRSVHVLFVCVCLNVSAAVFIHTAQHTAHTIDCVHNIHIEHASRK